MDCKVCGSTTIRVYDKQFDINYFRCPDCEFISMDQSRIVSFHEERKIYDMHNNTIENQGYVDMFKEFIDTCVLPYKKQGKLLDFGSGPEPVLVQVIDRDYKFETMHYDIHYSPTMVYEGHLFDVIVSTEVVEHINEPLEFFQLLSSLLRKDGILSIMTLFHLNDDEHFSGWWYRRDKTHVSFYTPKTLIRIANLCGLDLIYTDKKRMATFSKR